jgi:hypothetical protein
MGREEMSHLRSSVTLGNNPAEAGSVTLSFQQVQNHRDRVLEAE